MVRCAATSKDDVRRERDQFRRIPANALGIAGGPAIVNLHIAAVGPAQFLQPLHERSEACLPFRIVCCERHEHADAPHALALLRTCGKRPSGCRAPEQRDELAPLHCLMPPVLSTDRIARPRYGRRLLRCDISIQPIPVFRRMSAPARYGQSGQR